MELLQNAARDPSTVVDFDETIDPIEFGEAHMEEVELLEELSHVVHEVEEGEISAEEGLKEIRAILEAAEGEEAEHHHGEEGEGIGAKVLELIAEVDEGHMSAAEAMEEIDHLAHEAEHGGHLVEELGHVAHEVEDGDITPEEGLEEIRHFLEASESEEEHHHHGEEGEGIGAKVLEQIADVDEGHMSAEEAIEEIEHLTHEGEDEHAGHGHGIHDPHFWFDPLRVKLAVNDIEARLSELDPSRSDDYAANAAAYNAQLDELHKWTLEQVAAVPQDRRLLVTSHDSFGYFADLYGFDVVGVVLSITTDVEPSAEHLGELVHEVREQGVPAVFGETTVSERLAQTVADESGAVLVRLYSGSLGAGGSGADTYLGMVRTNVERIVNALK